MRTEIQYHFGIQTYPVDSKLKTHIFSPGETDIFIAKISKQYHRHEKKIKLNPHL